MVQKRLNSFLTLTRKISSPNTYQPPKSSHRANREIDAGLCSLDYYQRKLPPWRFRLRQKILPLIRRETPYLAWIQSKTRAPILDSYFAITANLGTHTFFMIFLPVLFWCGYTSLGRGMVHILAAGVFLTGVLKDLLSLPRPLSPPLHRISMSGSAALEYGFPSTHSANSVSVAVYVILSLYSLPDYQFKDSTKLLIEIFVFLYAFSIILGRLYCGMHGFIDVSAGCIIGTFISVIEFLYGARFDKFLYHSSWIVPSMIALVIILFIQFHPDPADDCPCFNDSVAFAGVMIGIEAGGWHYASGSWAWDFPAPATVPFDLNQMGWTVAILRIITGVLVIILWRETMKRILHKYLPRLIRLIKTYSLPLTQKIFRSASEYKSISSHIKMDGILQNIFDFLGLLRFIRHPTQDRSVVAVSQTATETYEILASNEIFRQNNISQTASFSYSYESEKTNSNCPSATNEKYAQSFTPGTSESIMNQSRDFSNSTSLYLEDSQQLKSFNIRSDGIREKEIFSKLQQPRVQYDFKVITNLIVYTGIAWLAVEINPIIFEIIGLGMGK